MKLPAGRIAAFLAKPDPAVRLILLYGPDAGLVRERADALARQVVSDLQDPFRVALLTGDRLKDDPSLLADEAATQSLGGGRRLVRVQRALDANAGAVEAFVRNPPSGDSLVLAEAGELDKRSRLRAACETDAPTACAIPCYVEDSAQRQRACAGILKGYGLEAGKDTLAALDGLLPPDRLALRSEMEKLALYAHGKERVTIEDVQAVIASAGAAEMDDLVQEAASGNAPRVALLLEQLWAEQASPVAIVRAAQRHFLRLHLARAWRDEGATAAEAIKKLRPPVFWKQEEPMARQVERWPLARLDRALGHLAETEAALKRTGIPDQTLCARALLQLAARG